jgi:exportin-1
VSGVVAAFLEIPPPQFKLVLDSVIWAFKHTMRNISEIGLDILQTMLKNISQFDQAAQNFYSLYFTDILQHVFSVVADSVHTGGKFSALLYITIQTIIV